MIPHLEQDGLAIFDHYVSGANCYLEYGSGGSTIRALQLKAYNIISVDSSDEWISVVGSAMSSSCNVNLIHCDIGPVGDWGRPSDQQGLSNYHSYMSKPWFVAKEKLLAPSVVLIDGRFRVASFLYSLLCAQPGTIILFDDYMNRPQYHVVEQFCCPYEVHGRMAIFVVSNCYRIPEIVAKIAEYSIIYD